MNKHNSEYLSLRDGVVVQAETLKEAIENNQNIEMVVLFWCWQQDYYASHAGPFDAYVSESSIDSEYSFMGNRKDALEYASDYDCWDGVDFVILRGNTLYGYNEEYDSQTSWNDGYDHRYLLGDGPDPRWISFIRVDFDYETNTEYLLEPEPIPDDMIKAVRN